MSINIKSKNKQYQVILSPRITERQIFYFLWYIYKVRLFHFQQLRLSQVSDIPPPSTPHSIVTYF